MNKSTQLIIGMALGFERDHEIFEGVEWDADMASELMQSKSITKEDLFSTLPNGKNFFEYKQTWENLDKLSQYLEGDEKILTPEDLDRNIKGEILLKKAARCDAQKVIFDPEIWRGHAEEMENTWFRLDKVDRKNIDIVEVKSALARLEGREIREDVYKEAGFDVSEMVDAIKYGKYISVVDKLNGYGDHLRPEDALMCDEDGDHGFQTRMAWVGFEEFLDEMEKHGEKLDADFFLFKRPGRQSVIDYAFQHNFTEKVFNSRVFGGQPDELIRLYKNLEEKQQVDINIGALLSEIVEADSAGLLPIDDTLSVEALTAVLYKPAEDVGDWQPIIGLGLKHVWDNIEDVHNILKAKGENITLEHLRKSSGFGSETCLMKAAGSGKFEAVLDMLAENGERFEIDDIVTKSEGAEGKSVLNHLIEHEQVELLLKPELWAGRASALGAIWDKLPAEKQEDMNLRKGFQQTYTKANILALRTLEKPQTPPPPSPNMGPA